MMVVTILFLLQNVMSICSWSLDDVCDPDDKQCQNPPLSNPGEIIYGQCYRHAALRRLLKDLAGSCKGHVCTVSEICIPQSQTYTCVLLLEVFAEWRTRKGSLVSQNKGTGQSTPFDCHNVVVCKPGAGVDGIKEFNNMFHTNTEREPFWWVNLGQVYKVQKVVSTNRIHCCGYRLTKMLIHVGTSLDTSQMELCGQFIGPAVTRQVIVILCNTLPEGQVVKLTSVNTAPEVFHLAEVEVYAV
ncbi:Hypothetical predicted protein [Mytilus galloprovincialis]|uniref:Fucolectin tachylectin-4 pentraxin-1 domain-containing protein n=1 Tax=Mytilus galloprovincialis TaxID=29158 RepID=A0A8B6GWT4_MYTGA|nr:Hypothetical predicted protein [Mytilus galloprovincialis]